MNRPTLVQISRRTTLRWLAVASATSTVPIALFWDRHAKAPSAATGRSVSKGYGTDPDLLHPIVPWERTMNRAQLRLTAALADWTLPAGPGERAPSALGIHDFVDEWVSAPYPEQQADRAVICEGLDWFENEADKRWGRSFLQLGMTEQRLILDAAVPRDPKSLTTVQERFFQRFRFLVIGAYYTTPEGFQAIGYVGNVPLPSYPGVTEQEQAILEVELRNLGLGKTAESRERQ